ncbi:hypothetical protein ACFYXS_00630 [Streptomyces sp. NPDC002574]|uniref:hypothetical protein n=1 Tax=Streptomyces sp. NPDC002574 TaxID=3364652 RepID=UPI00368E3C9B
MIRLLRRHQEEQARERGAAGADGQDKGYLFASPTGEPSSPNTGYHGGIQSVAAMPMAHHALPSIYAGTACQTSPRTATASRGSRLIYATSW